MNNRKVLGLIQYTVLKKNKFSKDKKHILKMYSKNRSRCHKIKRY